MKKHQGPSDALNEWKKLVDQFVHDMASPLAFLEQYVLANIRGEKVADGGDVDLDETAMRCLRKFRTLLEQIRYHSRLSEMAFSVSDYAEAIRCVVQEMALLARPRNVTVAYAGPSRLIGCFMREGFERALSNLCKNALEAMPPTGGAITVSLANDNGSVWIEVTDNGSGMSIEAAERIFERGYSKGKKGGTGLGLSFCKNLVEAHGGSARVFSDEGRGTVFSLGFPIIAAVKVRESRREDLRSIEAVLWSDHPGCQKELLEKLDADCGTEVIELASHDFETSRPREFDFTLDPM